MGGPDGLRAETPHPEAISSAHTQSHPHPGDGTSPSIADAAVKVIEGTGVRIEWEMVEARLPAM